MKANGRRSSILLLCIILIVFLLQALLLYYSQASIRSVAITRLEARTKPNEINVNLQEVHLFSRAKRSEDLFALAHFFLNTSAGTFFEVRSFSEADFSNTHLFQKHLGWKGAMVLWHPTKTLLVNQVKEHHHQIMQTEICKLNQEFRSKAPYEDAVQYVDPTLLHLQSSSKVWKSIKLSASSVYNDCSILGPINHSFLPSCVELCKGYTDLDAATAACVSEPKCSGITGSGRALDLTYELRAEAHLHPSVTGEVSYVLGPCSINCAKAQNTTSKAFKVDFLSIGLDISALKVLNALQLDKYVFSVIHIASPSKDNNQGNDVRNQIESSGYEFYMKDAFDGDWYHHNTVTPKWQHSFILGAEELRFYFGSNCSQFLTGTRQYFAAAGFVLFQNIYFIGSNFVFIESNQSLDLSKWALLDGSVISKKWGHVGPNPAWQRPFGSLIVKEHQASCSVFRNLVHHLLVKGAVIITDFLPRMVPHLYHMLEHLLGIWATKVEFQVQENPVWIVFPQNGASTFGSPVLDLIEYAFPRARLIDSSMLKIIASKYSIEFTWALTSDRSAADHGKVNQMLSGALPLVTRGTTSFKEALLKNINGAKELGIDFPIRISYISRRGSRNRKLSDLAESNMIMAILKNTNACQGMYAFETVTFENSRLLDQVWIAHSSRVLLGVHGNGLSNLLWMSPPGHVIEIFPNNTRILAYQQFAESRGLWYFGFAANGVVYKEGSCGTTAESYSELCGHVLEQSDGINSIIEIIDYDHLAALVYAAILKVARTLGLQVSENCLSSLLPTLNKYGISDM